MNSASNQHQESLIDSETVYNETYISVGMCESGDQAVVYEEIGVIRSTIKYFSGASNV